MPSVLAILISDLHLSHAAPVARSAEPDWYAAMARPLDQIKELVSEYGCPVICAGDVFDKWNSPPELINWAIEHLPKIYAIPGQHDLPLHSYEDIHKSAFWTLVEAKVVKILDYGQATVICEDWDDDGVARYSYAWGVPWGKEINYPKKDRIDKVYLAVVHAYVWQRGKEYAGASQGEHLSSYKAKLKGYSAAVFGDNHQGFLAKCNGVDVLNCGCLIRRKSDERKYKPAVGLLYDDGHIEQHFLDVSEDKWLEPEEIIERVEAPGMTEFLEELNQLESDSLDFKEAVRRYIKDNPVGDGARRVLLEVIGG